MNTRAHRAVHLAQLRETLVVCLRQERLLAGERPDLDRLHVPFDFFEGDGLIVRLRRRDRAASLLNPLAEVLP